MVRRSGTVSVNGERAIYKKEISYPDYAAEAIIAFYDEETNQSWIGQEPPIYVATIRGIIGLMPSGTVIAIFKPLVNYTGTATDFQHFWAAFDQDSRTWEKLGKVRRDVVLESLPFDFGTVRPGSSQGGTPKINAVRLKGGEIILDLSSQGGDYRAIVAIDENTLKLISATLVK